VRKRIQKQDTIINPIIVIWAQNKIADNGNKGAA